MVDRGMEAPTESVSARLADLRSAASAVLSVRPFQLLVDSGSREEPPTRYFGTLAAALEALESLPEHFRRFASVTEIYREDGQQLVHVRDGVPVPVSASESCSSDSSGVSDG